MTRVVCAPATVLLVAWVIAGCAPSTFRWMDRDDVVDMLVEEREAAVAWHDDASRNVVCCWDLDPGDHRRCTTLTTWSLQGLGTDNPSLGQLGSATETDPLNPVHLGTEWSMTYDAVLLRVRVTAGSNYDEPDTGAIQEILTFDVSDPEAPVIVQHLVN